MVVLWMVSSAKNAVNRWASLKKKDTWMEKVHLFRHNQNAVEEKAAVIQELLN